MRDKKIGLVGLGNTGYTTARVAIGFGMQVYALTSKSHFQLPPEIKKMDLDQLFSECDIISLHCPLTPETHEMVNARRLAMMKPTAILINTGRGPLINEQDLADALNSGKIFAAGVDVLSTEPPHADNPLLTAKNSTYCMGNPRSPRKIDEHCNQQSASIHRRNTGKCSQIGKNQKLFFYPVRH